MAGGLSPLPRVCRVLHLYVGKLETTNIVITVNISIMKRNNSDRKLREQLRIGRKALKYVRDKTEDRERVMKTFLEFPEIESPMSFINEALNSNTEKK